MSFKVRKTYLDIIGQFMTKRRRVWQLNPLPLFTLTSKLCFDLNLKVLKTLGFWNYT